VASAVVVEGDLHRHLDDLVADDPDLLDEVQDHATLRRHRELAEVVLEGGGEALQLLEVQLEGAAVVVVLAQQLGLFLDLALLHLEAGDVLAADLRVEAVADRPEVVLDAAVDVGETAVELARVLAVAAAARLDLRADELL
jgi:hypothetical protein